MDWKNEIIDPEMQAFEERRVSNSKTRLIVWPEAISRGYARVSCAIEPDMLNPFGNAHGGVIDYVMDTSAGICSTHSIEPLQVVVTRSCEMHYIAPIQGSKMYAVARAVKPGRRCCLICVEAYDENQKLCALGNFEMFYPGIML